MRSIHFLLLQSTTETNSILARFIIVIGLVIVAMSLGCLIFFIVARQNQNKLYLKTKAMEELEKQLLLSQVEVQEATLSSIGRELHDNVGQLLSSSKMLLAVAQRNHQNAEGAIKNADELIGQAIGAIRGLAKMFDRDWLRQFDLIVNLDNEITRNNVVSDLKIHFSHPNHLSLNADDQVVLFRIIQEAVQNSVKHADASNIYIEIREVDRRVTVVIADDGTGFDVGAQNKSGVGLNNIKIRTKSLGGTVSWKSSGSGTEVSITMMVR